MERKPIRIPMSLIHKVTEKNTPDSLRALALAVMIKANFVSSVFKDADITSLMPFFHLKHATLKKALNKALEMGLVTYTYRTDSKGVQHKDLKAVKLDKDGRSTVKLNICDSNCGRIVYIHTNQKDLHEQYQNSTSYQSINDVMDLLITAKIISLFKRHNKILDCQLRQACIEHYKRVGEKYYNSFKTLPQYEYLYRKMQRKVPVGVINTLNCGYSLEKIQSCFGSFVTRYKLQKLLHKSDQKHDYLFHVWENRAFIDQTERIKNHAYKVKPTPKDASPLDIFKVAYDNYDAKVDGMRQAYKERFIDTDEEGQTIHLYHDRGCFISKKHKRCLVRPMANTYYIQCDPFVTTGKKHRRIKKTDASKNIKIVAPSVQSHVNIDALPF